MKIIQHFCKHKIFFFSSNIFFSSFQKVKVKIFSSRQNKNLQTLLKSDMKKYFTLSQRNQTFGMINILATIKQLLSPLQKVLQRFNLFQILKEVYSISLQRSNNFFHRFRKFYRDLIFSKSSKKFIQSPCNDQTTIADVISL